MLSNSEENKLSEFGNLTPERINLVNIVAVGRSSSIFLQGLFDGHPKIITLLGFISIKNKKTTNQSIDSLLEEIYLKMDSDIKFLSRSYNLEREFPKKIFMEYTKRYISNFGLNKKTLFIGVHYAYARYLKKDLNKIKYILAPSHTPGEAMDSLKAFPNQRMIFTVRDPRSNLLSFKKIGNLIGGILLQKYGFMLFKRMLKYKPTNVLALRHEDLHLRFGYTKKRLLNFLKIPDSKELNSSTFFRKPFYGMDGSSASSTNLKSNFPNPKFVSNSWRNELSTSEIKDVQSSFSQFMGVFGYKKIRNFEPLQIEIIGTRFVGLSEDTIRDKRGLSKIALIFLRKIYNFTIIGRIICKILIAGIFLYDFIKKSIKIKYSKL